MLGSSYPCCEHNLDVAIRMCSPKDSYICESFQEMSEVIAADHWEIGVSLAKLWTLQSLFLAMLPRISNAVPFSPPCCHLFCLR